MIPAYSTFLLETKFSLLSSFFISGNKTFNSFFFETLKSLLPDVTTHLQELKRR